MATTVARFVLAVLSLIFGVCTAWAQSTSSTDAAKAALERGDYASAETLYKEALLHQPQSAEILTNLGVTMQMQGRSTDAIQVFEQALKLKHLDRTYALLAQEKCKSRDLEGARPMLARILKEDRSDSLILSLVAPCYLDLDEPIKATEVYGVLVSAPSFPRDLALIQLSKAYLRCSRFFFGRLATTPGSAIFIQAIRNARNRTSPDERGAFANASRSSAYFRADLSFPEAVKLWRQHPSDAALLYLLSVLSSEESMKLLSDCFEQFSDSIYLQQLKFDMLADQGHENEAIEGYEQLLQSHPTLPDLRYGLGMLYRKQQRWEEALTVFRQQLASDPQDERSAARVSESLEELGRWDELSRFLEPRMKRTNPPLWASLDYAEAAENLNNPGLAIRTLAAAEKSDASSKSIHFRLLRLYRKTGNVTQANVENTWLLKSRQ